MTDKVQKISNEVKRLRNELIQEREKGFGSDVDDACILELQNVLTYIDSLQEEPVSEDLEKAAEDYGIRQGVELKPFAIKFFKAGAKWQKEKDGLTWEDIEAIDQILTDVFKDGFDAITNEYYQEVLNRFNKRKGK